jgi:ATP-dependent RNA helicase DHX8/PRP22
MLSTHLTSPCCPDCPPQELRGFNLVADLDMPEWKKKALGKAPTYGIKDDRPISEQRKSLPIYKLKEQLLTAVHDHKVCCCCGLGRLGAAGLAGWVLRAACWQPVKAGAAVPPSAPAACLYALQTGWQALSSGHVF